jgi:uncharacterized membrane protein HdeD (DUF308 family)
MSPFGPPWKLGVTGAIAVTAAVALVFVDWTITELAAFVAMLLVARGALHLTTTSFNSVTGALGTLQGGAEIGVGVLLLAWPHPTLLVVSIVVGTLFAAQGIVDLTIVLATRNEHGHWRARLAADIVQVVLSVALVARPTGSVRAASLILGALALLAGGIEIAAAVSQVHSPRRAVSVQ